MNSRRSRWLFWSFAFIGLVAVILSALLQWRQSKEQARLALLTEARSEAIKLWAALDNLPSFVAEAEENTPRNLRWQQVEVRLESLGNRIASLHEQPFERGLASLDRIKPALEMRFATRPPANQPEAERLLAEVRLVQELAPVRQGLEQALTRVGQKQSEIIQAIQIEDWMILALPLIAAVCALGMIDQGGRLWHQVRRQAGLEQAKREATEELRRTRDQLEQRVIERTAQLNATVAQLETLVQSAPIGIAFLDCDFQYQRVNATYALLTGRPVEEHSSRTVADLDPQVWSSMEPHFQQVLTTHQPVLGVHERHGTPDGPDARDWLVSYFPVLSTNGEILGLGLVSLDATRQVQAQVSIEQANAQLEQRVQERTQQLAQTVQELERAMTAAEEAHQAKGDFLARMSHEIRTPMNGVLGMTDLLLDGETSSHQRELLHVVKASGKHLLELIDDILDFSRMEAGKLEINVAPFRLRDLLADLLKPLAVRAESKGVELIADIGPEVSDRLVGDAGRLRQVLVNLIGNAIKFTEKGEVVVRVRVIKRKGNREKIAIRFEVSDSGIGIPLDRLNLIFEPFVQADGTLARKYGGTGLGLTISSRLVSLMGGTIQVESELGRGSTFQFVVELDHEAGSFHDHFTGNPLAGTRVLVVDDSANNRLALTEMLRGWGMIATQETSVLGAVQALNTAAECGEPFRVVLFDGAMLPLPAGQWAKGREEAPGRCDVGVVLVSLAARRKETTAWREAANQVVCKPIHQADLLEAIQTALGMSKLVSRSRDLANQKTIVAEPPVRSLYILLAEDNRFNQKVAITTLEREGHRVNLAETGREALDMIEKNRFDVVLMDVQMPEMDGLEAVRLLRAREQINGGRVPVLALTAHAMRSDEERCMAAGMDGYLTKPLDREALRRELRRLTHAQEWEAIAPSSAAVEPEPGNGTTAVFNQAATLTRGNGDRQLVIEIAGLYRTESERILEEMSTALNQDDARTTTRLAHTLRGSSAFFDARQVVALAAAVEQAGELDQMRQTLPELRRAVSDLCAALELSYGGAVG